MAATWLRAPARVVAVSAALSLVLVGCRGGSHPAAVGPASKPVTTTPSAVAGSSLPTSESASTAPLSAAVSSTGAAGQSSSETMAGVTYIRYVNDRFGFSVDVPSSFVAEPPPTDGDGEIYDGDAGLVKLTVFGELNVTGITPSSAGSWIDGETGTTDTVKGPVSVVSGTFNGNGRTMVGYARTVVGSGTVYVLEWTYPASQAATYDAQVAHTVASFQPGNLN
jgi:hypothetical protein